MHQITVWFLTCGLVCLPVPTWNSTDPRRPCWAAKQSGAEMTINCIKNLLPAQTDAASGYLAAAARSAWPMESCWTNTHGCNTSKRTNAPTLPIDEGWIDVGIWRLIYKLDSVILMSDHCLDPFHRECFSKWGRAWLVWVDGGAQSSGFWHQRPAFASWILV